MPDTCLAKFEQPSTARAAIRRLLQSGVSVRDMEVMTCQPAHGAPFLPETHQTKLRTWALAGAAAGLVGGVSLATFTALSYPLVKGGMPIVAPWTVGLVAYETTMLGAVLATAAGLLIELRLPNFKNLPYDETIVDGGVLLAVKCPDRTRASVQDVVSAAGAVTVKWV